MELRHLRYFVTVAKLLNFTKAAAKLHVAQPALSRQIRDLEDELGVQLLERNSRFVRLTVAGATFVHEARAVLDRAQEAVQAARTFATGERGEIQLGYAPSPTVELLPQALQAVQKDSPGVRVTLHDLSVQEMLQGLREGRLDAALTVASSSKQMSGLAFEPLRTYPFCVAVNTSHRLARTKRVNLSQLKDERLIVYSRADYPEYYESLASMFQSLGAMPEIAEEHDSATSLIAAIEAGRGIALVPSALSPLAGSRITLREIQPSPIPLVVGVDLSSTPSRSRRAPVYQDCEPAGRESDEANRKSTLISCIAPAMLRRSSG
jgi:LysR family transcriptional regulator, benzoate and cis,cis-muconate-responsive activator of ben and cat genes